MSELQKSENRFRRINRIAVVLYLALAGAALIYGAVRRDAYAALQAGAALAMLPVPALVERLTRFRLPQDGRFLYYLFVFCTVVVGSSLYGYGRIPYWDKLFHFLSGFLISAAGLAVCRLLAGQAREPQGRERALALVFTVLFNIAVAALWEMYEYLLYLLFGIDAVNTLTTGVNDTMQDMLVCTLGGLLFLLDAIRYFYRGKGSFLIHVYRHFFALRES